MIHPRLRLEMVSDLDQKFSAQPGLGGRHSVDEDFSILWNLGFLQRAPNFNELYFEIPREYIPNPGLERETSLQGDLGYEWNLREDFFWRQTAFFNRRNDLIETVTDSNFVSQAQNMNSAWSYGIESEWRVSPVSWFEAELSYTFLWAKVSSDRENLFDFIPSSGSREEYYQPEHKLFFTPRFLPDPSVQLSVPLYARSSVLAPFQAGRVQKQWDLGFDLKILPRRIFPLETKVQLRNLLSWSREETLGYPLSHEPSFEILFSLPLSDWKKT